ncbi:hypothetical protein KNE206_65700 [Kitasatospora sp. NE20-6]|uniref:SAV_915 family protein n=1 Tax=Kitasatospora sp. NE20-6 TaxID=2859066 RepID=UPI0034DBF9E7
MTRTDPAPAAPEEPRHHLHVPVRAVSGAYALRLFKQRDGIRCAVAFTSRAALTALLGPAQHSVELAEPALRALAAPLGAVALVVDPQMVAAPVVGPIAPVPASPQLPALLHRS